MNDRQIAKFSIDALEIHGRPDFVADVFRLLNAVVVRAESIWANRTIEYTAISERFEDIPEGATPPWVDLEIAEVHGRVACVEVVYPSGPGGHRFANGVCRCGHKTSDDPERCPLA